MNIETDGIHIIPEDVQEIEVRCDEPVIIVDTPKSEQTRIFHIHADTTCSIYGYIQNNYTANVINQ